MNQSSNPKVSIIVPVYGVSQYVGKCIQSLLSQDYDNIEFIIVNDCTPDNSMEVIYGVLSKNQNRMQQVKVINHEINKGLSAARESGICNSTGDYILHVDSDDYVETSMVSKCVKEAISANVDIVNFGCYHDYGFRQVVDLSCCRRYDKMDYLSKTITQDLPTNIWGHMFKRSLYTDNDIHCIPGVNYAEDYAVLPKLIWYSQSMRFVKEPLYHYVHYNSNSYTNKFSWRNIENNFRAENEIVLFFYARQKFRKELSIQHLRNTAWAIRQIEEAHEDIKKGSTIWGAVDYKIRYFFNLSLNHNILLILYVLELYNINRIFIRISKKIKNKIYENCN
jgi:glycosyltransferase involved in cell wall biosynthesis